MFNNPKATWNDAQNICGKYGARLMTLETPEKMKFMKGRRTNKPGLEIFL